MATTAFPVNPELTAIAIGYRNRDVDLIADRVLPRVTTAKRFNYRRYPAGEAYTLPSTRVGRKSDPTMVDFSGTDTPDECIDYALDDLNRLVGSVDLAGGGTPLGTVPRYAALLRACGLAEAITATTRVDYTPVSGAEDSASIYHFLDGTRQQGLGARGDFSIEMQARQTPRIRFDLQGLYVAPTAVALPVPTLTGFQAPLPVNQVNTPTCTLNGQAVVLRQFQYRHGNQITMRDMPGSRALRITGRQPTASVTIEAPDALSPNFFSSIGASVAFSIVHGTVGGNICTIDLAQAQLLNPRYSNEDNIAMLSFDLRPLPTSAGNDEFRLRLT